MITLFTGAPGAGKTASLVDFLSKLEGDRPLYVDGLNGLTLHHTACDANNWHTELPDGAILVIDEVQRVWRPRGAAAKVPDSVAALETHRHRGIDVYMTTQAPTLLDSNVRRLVGRHVHIRDTGVLGRYWYEWPEVSDAMQWKTCVNKRRITLPKKAFGLYKSSSLHTTPVRTIPKALYVMAFAFLAFAALAYYAYGRISSIGAPTPTPAQNGPVVASPMPPLASAEAMPLDDRLAFIPRVSNRPESAPAYDGLRQVVAMPTVVGGVCMGERCKCYTAQATDAGLSAAECKTWLQNPPFDPYKNPNIDAQVVTPNGAIANPSRLSDTPASLSPTKGV